MVMRMHLQKVVQKLRLIDSLGGPSLALVVSGCGLVVHRADKSSRRGLVSVGSGELGMP